MGPGTTSLVLLPVNKYRGNLIRQITSSSLFSRFVMKIGTEKCNQDKNLEGREKISTNIANALEIFSSLYGSKKNTLQTYSLPTSPNSLLTHHSLQRQSIR